ncbi:putative ferric-chelate reductase 1 isoform X2 [Mytilus trossulus]
MEISMKASLASLSSGGDWISVGLSSDEKMGSDSVFDCITDGTQVLVERSTNPARFNLQISPRDSWITIKTNSYSSGILMCSFEAEKSNAAGIDFDTDWYMFFGTGEWNQASKKKHSITPKISSEKVDLQKYDVIGGSPQNIMLKLHGIMMISAWILCASIGVVVARYYKPVWLEKKFLGEKVWFTLHRGVMVLAVLFCIAGFTIIFVDRGTFQEIESDSDFKKAHPFIGIIVMCLAIIQPVMAVFRPHPGDNNRIIFNWAHWGVGIVSHFLGVLNILIGVLLDAMQMPIWVVYVVVAYAVYQFLIEFVLEIYDCVSRRKSASEAYEMRERDSLSKQDTKQDSEYNVKKTILGIHITVICLFAIALIILVSMDLSIYI